MKLDITNVIYFFYNVLFSNVQVSSSINLFKYVNLGVRLINCKYVVVDVVS